MSDLERKWKEWQQRGGGIVIDGVTGKEIAPRSAIGGTPREVMQRAPARRGRVVKDDKGGWRVYTPWGTVFPAD